MDRKPKQQSFGFKKPKKRGRPKSKTAGEPHVRRGALSRHHPVHVNWHVLPEVWTLQARKSFRMALRAFQAARERHGMRITHFSVQANHVHLVVEAEHQRALSRGMQGLGIRLAKGINALMERTGRVFSDRYHAHVCRTPDETFAAVKYVLGNTLVHARRRDPTATLSGPDLWSAGPNHDVGWRWFFEEDDQPPVAEPKTWLLQIGWTRALRFRQRRSLSAA